MNILILIPAFLFTFHLIILEGIPNKITLKLTVLGYAFTCTYNAYTKCDMWMTSEWCYFKSLSLPFLTPIKEETYLAQPSN